MSVHSLPNNLAGNDWQFIGNGFLSKSPGGSRSPRIHSCEIKRYGAYFRGWCQTFDEHVCIPVGDREAYWLLAKKQVGLVLPNPQIKLLYREVLLNRQVHPLTFCHQSIQLGAFPFPLNSECEEQVVSAFEQLIETGPDLHVYLTSHLLYGNESRIITFSNTKPRSIIYREIGTLQVRLL